MWSYSALLVAEHEVSGCCWVDFFGVIRDETCPLSEKTCMKSPNKCIVCVFLLLVLKGGVEGLSIVFK